MPQQLKLSLGWGSIRLGFFFKLFDFFLPRMVTLTPPFPCLPPQSILNISNNNYCPITVTQLTIEVLHLSLVVGQVSHSLLLHIGPLASEQMFYAVTNRINDENTYKICTWLEIKVHHVLLYIQGTLTYSYLSRSEQLVFQSYEYVDCRGNTSVPHLLVSHPP